MTNILLYAPNAPTSGVTNAIYSLHKGMNHKKLKINVITWPENQNLCQLARDFNGEFYPMKIFYWRHPVAYRQRLMEILQTQKFDVVVFNISSITTLYPFKIALRTGINKIIAYSHSSNIEASNCIKRLFLTSIHYMKRPGLRRLVNTQLCCSHIAGEWLFGPSKKYIIIKNAITLKKYKFNQDLRDEFRNALNVEDEIIIGNVGRLSYAKNQKFLLEIFEHVIERRPNSQLWIIGEGPLRKELESEIIHRSLQSKVRLWGTRNDIDKLLNCMDCFVLPSLFEGAPVAAIEAQANGLPCIISSNVDLACIITSNAISKALSDSDISWAETIIALGEEGHQANSIAEMQKMGWDLKNATNQLEKIYVS